MYIGTNVGFLCYVFVKAKVFLIDKKKIADIPQEYISNISQWEFNLLFR